ncbi:hypothetical protein LEP3755_55670 [Leptolyngbya sp. NIES-3755]|nr:hypothetical protein LEP3755_55670 [Leptolyngbya sp. NIES-3755]
MPSILNENQTYTFSNFFELRLDAIDLANYFGYQFRRAPLSLPQYSGTLDRLPQLEEDLFDIIPRLVRMNEQSKREALIFPVIKTAARYANALIRIEQPLKITHQLQGSLDYLLSTDNLHQLVVIEAKQGDIDYGFTQLLSELIALDQWERSPTQEQQPQLIGAVTIGELWRFGILDRMKKQIIEDVIGYRVPSDLEMLLRLLIQALL